MTVIDNVDPNPSSDDIPSEEEIDEQRRHFLVTTTSVLGGVGVACALTPFVASWFPSAKAQAAGAPVQVDLSKIEPGQQVTVEWRGRPVWIIRRTKEMLQQLSGHDEQLRDPDSLVDQQPTYAKNQYRSIKPEYLILVGVCTHLGCSPKYTPVDNELGPNWPGGFYCPCHGSTFDLAGRVFKGVPAPINLEVPPYQFISEHVIVIGQDKEEG
ncbi:TPA: ubiquinol-cytochrome c reductase iron-sulfur subunit [Legionella feeleii]|uniref:Ubiquinol-cytochrome c reductase iron-sulfur subunit n=1 Tax=Legionella feeleii TaxID=453 RepID=A0A0W0THJ1_9GAMM|nr:ubiquinol-cytochrome c reductase iron-sulfur subunit [Legionella feeleii]KTC95052.1 ubiquinol--cytochrome c reductase, iron-sulfur subunit [Legionella feeleii]SPX61730.1 ubiquinol--cytochrome c reductase, iron-sulfur subunit [Legionella feeleii]STX39422.1 ubiquinol--cytochrome c reductase, iron-sulfur subunit [Legionella feeleii]